MIFLMFIVKSNPFWTARVHSLTEVRSLDIIDPLFQLPDWAFRLNRYALFMF